MNPLSRLASIGLILIACATLSAAQGRRNSDQSATPGVRTIYVKSSTVYLKPELMSAVLQSRPEFAASGLKMAGDPEDADLVLDVTRPFLTFDWVFRLTQRGNEIASGVVHGWDAQEVAPKIAAEVARQLPKSTAPPKSEAAEVRSGGKRVYVHSDTVYLSDEQLRGAMSFSRQWKNSALELAPDRANADLMVDVKRPFFTFDWNWTVRDTRTSAVLAAGKVVAVDGEDAAPGLASDIVAALAEGPAVAASPQRSWNVTAVGGTASALTSRELAVSVAPDSIMLTDATGKTVNVPKSAITAVKYSTLLRDPSQDVYRAWGQTANFLDGVARQSSDDVGAAAATVLLGVSPLYLGAGLAAGLDRRNEPYVQLTWTENEFLRAVTLRTADQKQADELFSALSLAQQQARAKSE